MSGFRSFFGSPLDTDQVVEMFRETIASELTGHKLRASDTDPLSFVLVCPETKKPALSVNAHNVVREIITGGYDRTQAGYRIAQFAGMIAAALAPETLNIDALYLALRHHDYADTARAALVCNEGPGDLRLVIAEDRGAYVSLPSAEALEEVGLSVADAFDIAEKNLREVMPRLETYVEDSGLFSMSIEDYDWLSSGMLLVPKLLQGFARHHGMNALLIAAPSFEMIHVADAGQPRAVSLLEEVMNDSFQRTRMHSECVFYLPANEAGAEVRVAHVMQNQRLVATN